MDIELRKVKIAELCEGYIDNDIEGVHAYSGKLDVRPKYQREFVYTPERQVAVINSIMNNLPIGVMYWMETDAGPYPYELLDGQQRTVSICRYYDNKFLYNGFFFKNLVDEERDKFLNYEILVYICLGSDRERLEWYRTINIAGVAHTEQEILNAIYAGPWLSAAKIRFSKPHCTAYMIAGGDAALIDGSPVRQDFLEAAIKWAALKDGCTVEEYMAKHQNDPDADELWQYFESVVNWVRSTFPNYRREMQRVNWGALYIKYKNMQFDTEVLEKRIKALMEDDDVTKKPGIYPYVLSEMIGHPEPSHLSIRKFTNTMKRKAYERQNGKCARCGQACDFEDMDADHILPWSKGGRTIPENCQMLCKKCNRTKSNK